MALQRRVKINIKSKELEEKLHKVATEGRRPPKTVTVNDRFYCVMFKPWLDEAIICLSGIKPLESGIDNLSAIRGSDTRQDNAICKFKICNIETITLYSITYLSFSGQWDI